MTERQKTPLTGKARERAIRMQQFVYRLAKRWPLLFNGVIGLYVGLPILAPVLMNAGATAPARIIYAAYSPMCHQMASRSFFLFGEQLAYPRAIAGSDNFAPLEAYTARLPEFSGVENDNWGDFFLAARAFVGNDQLGYKMALCSRDIAIYGFLFLGGVVYAILRHQGVRIRPLPLWAFILIGMGPIGLDGFSQLFGYFATPIGSAEPLAFQRFLAAAFPVRESQPFFRTFTGALFGLMLAWLIYPHLASSFKQTELRLAEKLERIDRLVE